MISILRGLRMADEGIGERYFVPGFFGLVALVCLFEAGDSYRAHQWEPGTIWLVLGTGFAIVAFKWRKIRKWFWRKPEIDILWKPGGFPYHYEYPLPPGHMNVQYRVCVVNNTNHALSSVRVTLTRLVPLVLNCVPCPLKLMHDNTPPYPTSFN